METFITSVCTTLEGVETCEYGGAFLYVLLFLLLTALFAVVAWTTIKVIRKLL